MAASMQRFKMKRPTLRPPRALLLALTAFVAWVGAAGAETPRDLAQIRKAGTLRHLVIPYARFVTGGGDGLDVEVVQRFAADLGVRYEQVPTEWATTIGDLTGRTYVVEGDGVRQTGTTAVRGDIIGHGMTVLPWRQKVVAFSEPAFPTQIWLLVPADHPLAPIKPSGDLADDIAAVEAAMGGLQVLCKPGTCLDPKLYGLENLCAQVVRFEGSLNHMAPAVLDGIAEATILDVPDALEALRRFPGRFKVIGPLSKPQHMAYAFAPEASELQRAFASFFAGIIADGTYLALVRNYYPAVVQHFPAFFTRVAATP